MAGSARRTSIGFNGGQVLSLRLSSEALDALHAALGAGGWHALETEDGPVRIDIGQVAYVRAESDEPRVGFGA